MSSDTPSEPPKLNLGFLSGNILASQICVKLKNYITMKIFYNRQLRLLWQGHQQGHHKFALKYATKKTNQIASALHSFSTIFSYTWAGNASVYSMKSMFWTNKKLSLMVAWSSSVSISCFKVQSSIGHLVWFFDSGNSIVSGANLWCPWWFC